MEQTRFEQPIVEEDRESFFSAAAKIGLRTLGKGASNVVRAFTRYKGKPRPPVQLGRQDILSQQNNLLVTPNHLLLNQNPIQQSQPLPVGRLSFWNA